MVTRNINIIAFRMPQKYLEKLEEIANSNMQSPNIQAKEIVMQYIRFRCNQNKEKKN